MPKMIVEFTDGSVNEFYACDREGLIAHWHRLKNTVGYQILEVPVPTETKYYGRNKCLELNRNINMKSPMP